jgi:glycine/D-amino acid oxidase-like deaminating enzyme
MQEPYDVWDKTRIASVTGSEHYAAAIHTPGTCLVQPAALIRGLADALPAGVRLFENSAVQTIDSSAQGVTVTTANGELTADRALICVNGHLAAFDCGWPRLFPLQTFASLTVPVATRYPSSPLLQRPPWGLISEDKMGATLRWTPDGRLLIRNSIVYAPNAQATPDALETVFGRHRRSLAVRFPEIQDLPFEFSWGGTVGVTLNAVPQFSYLGERILIAGGCNGVGIALGAALGVLAADQIAGRPSAELEALQSLPKPSPLPPRAIMRFGVPATLAWMQWRSGSDA